MRVALYLLRRWRLGCGILGQNNGVMIKTHVSKVGFWATGGCAEPSRHVLHSYGVAVSVGGRSRCSEDMF